MRQFFFGLSISFLLVFLLWFFFFNRQEITQGAGRKIAWEEQKMGIIPKAWGEIVGITTIRQQTIIILFQDGKGALRRVQWNPNGIVKNVARIDRAY